MQQNSELAVVEEVEPKPQWQLKTLTEKHKQVAALLAQGLKRGEIAAVVDITPEYVTMLAKQPLFIGYLKEMIQFTNVRLEALFEKSVQVISDAMDNGNFDEKLKGAKLQMEATGRIGRYQTEPPPAGGGDKLEALAERLVGLLSGQKRRVIDGQVTEVIVSEQDGQHPEGSP